MAVDEKYIEEVTDEEMDYESVLDEFGIEASYEQIGNGVDMSGYMQTALRDMYPEDIYTGKPVLSEIYEVEFKDKSTGETTVNTKIDLVLFDNTYPDEKEAFIFPLNINVDNLDTEKHTVSNVHSSSGLYALAMGLMELKAKGISKSFNKLDVVGLNSLKKQVEAYKTLSIEIVEREFSKGSSYNSFKIVEGEL